MCLTTSLKKPLVAQSDIKVYKCLEISNNEYLTPVQHTPVKLNDMLIAKGKSRIDFDIAIMASMDRGFIHAYTSPYSENEMFFEAIIPKGTEYYISSDFSQICAKKLFITDIKVTDKGYRPNVELCNDYLSQQEFKDGEVVVGDVVFNDLTIKHITEVENFDNIIGVVGLVENGHILVCSLKQDFLKWAKFDDKSVMSGFITDDDDARKDETNKKYFNEIVDNSNVNIDDYPAFKYCKEYGVGGQSWYLGGIGEMYRMIRNGVTAINVTLSILQSHKIDNNLLDKFYWSSPEGSSTYAWYVATANASVGYWYNKWDSFYVRPVFAINVA